CARSGDCSGGVCYHWSDYYIPAEFFEFW
nr:immunoglobulin heavy chain junction region [Macaca mulatta]MOV38897.1 immunoglobulin heavy chain junction region [Macaca mulatta]MOV41739.1 immunoglobulin heavy chain junction region [Macaca mulatta]MOV41792.1 immunoglobulin heavy chain junction region [Macaca mulatta]MOV42478.1 immunoglobulin heavy chain junction region [Macaca mulatta]